jgi:hypothetical protein
MPLTEINVTNPPPVYANYWRDRDARRAAAPPPPPWPTVDPGLLEDGRPKLPAFPLKVFPRQWREWVSDAAHWAGSSEDYIAQALLASVAGLCGQGVSARITEAWSEPVILWQALVGGPSSGKTPALDWLRRPLGAVERMLAREGGAPVVVSDASLPALEKAVARRPQGVLLWRDEPTAWLAGLGRKSRRDESRRGPFLDTWGAIGFPWSRDKSAVSTAVSIVGSLDPERLDAALEGAGDGLAARFLYVWPGPAPYRSLRTVKPVREDEMVNALQRIARAVGTPEKPLVLAFEDQAVTIFDTCLERLHGETLRAEGLLAGWLGKGRGTVARLAAVLALLDWTANRPANAPPAVITAQHLHAAWDLWDRYYRPHAQAVFERAGPSDRHRKVRQVVGWIRARGATKISREDVRREALRQTVKAAGADEVILALEQAGVLREVDDEEDYPGPGRPARRWQVNPALLARPAAQIAETPSLPSAAGEVSSSYGVGGVGSAKSLAQIAEKQTAPDSTEAGKADWPK